MFFEGRYRSANDVHGRCGGSNHQAHGDGEGESEDQKLIQSGSYSFSPEDVPADTDHDGMPDAWEVKYQLDPDKAIDSSIDSDDDGYTNVEEYLNGTNPRQKIDYTNLGNNVDTIS